MCEVLEEYCSFRINDIPSGVYTIIAALSLVCVPILILLYGNKKGVYYSLALLLFEYYLLLLGSMVVFRRTLGKRECHFEPFWSFHTRNSGIIVLPEHIMNVVIFMPIGLLLAILFRRLGLLKITVIGLLFSCMIEAFQFIFKRGVCEFDDVMNNTLGSFLGGVIVFGAHRLCRIIGHR